MSKKDKSQGLSNHDLFEKWRNKNEEELIGDVAYAKDIALSHNRYDAAWGKALNRLGLDETAALASFKKTFSEFGSGGSKLSLRSSGEGASRRQTPSVPLTTEKGLVATQTRPSSPTETKKSDIIPTSEDNIAAERSEVKPS